MTKDQDTKPQLPVTEVNGESTSDAYDAYVSTRSDQTDRSTPSRFKVNAKSDLNDALKAELSFPHADLDKAHDFVVEGGILTKESNKGRLFSKQTKRIFRANPENHTFVWESPNKKAHATKIHFSDVHTIHPIVVSKTPRGKSPKNGPESDSQELADSSRGGRDFEIVAKQRHLRLRAASRDEAVLWVTGLQLLLNSYKAAHTKRAFASFVHSQFLAADANSNGLLDIREVDVLMRRLNMSASSAYIQKTFKQFDTDNSGLLDEHEFEALLEKLWIKKGLADAFERHSSEIPGGGSGVSAQGLCEFMKESHPNESTSEDIYLDFIMKLKPPMVDETRTMLTEIGFSFLVCSPDNLVLDPVFSSLHQDMTLPLSHYWISTSHNTYLEDNQLTGISSVQQYISVLKRGCRCVEIDCWDGDDGEPIVTHGHTLTTKIKFENVIIACRDYGFEASPYPLILSFEMHCSDEQKVRIAHILMDKLGSMLLMAPEGDIADAKLVSPAEAKHRILVKAKLVKIRGSTDSIGETTGTESMEDVGDSEDSEAAEGSPLNKKKSIQSGNMSSQTASRSSASLKTSDSKARSSIKSKMKVTPDQLRLYNKCIYLAARKCKDINEARSPLNISSLSELKSNQFIKKYGMKLNEYHRDNLSRIYPMGTRVDSSNFLPTPHWIGGAHLVALNYQTADAGTLENEGRFRYANGGVGYILKPDQIRGIAASSGAGQMELQLEVVSAHFLPKPENATRGEVIDPLVQVKIAGASPDVCQHETGVITDNGFDPRWEHRFKLVISRPDVALIIFEVWDQDPVGREFIAAAAFPVQGLRPGLRWVPLWDYKFQPIDNCGIICRLSIQQEGVDNNMKYAKPQPATELKPIFDSAHVNRTLEPTADDFTLPAEEVSKRPQSQDESSKNLPLLELRGKDTISAPVHSILEHDPVGSVVGGDEFEEPVDIPSDMKLRQAHPEPCCTWFSNVPFCPGADYKR